LSTRDENTKPNSEVGTEREPRREGETKNGNSFDVLRRKGTKGNFAGKVERDVIGQI